MIRQLIINPGSTSTKIAVFEDSEEKFVRSISHSNDTLSQFKHIADQQTFRKNAIIDAVTSEGYDLSSFDSFVGRGGLLKPISGGTYEINTAMVSDLKEGRQGEHASNLAGIIAYELSEEYKARSFIVDPVVVDELAPVARLSGHPAFERVSIFHALNQKSVARKFADDQGQSYEDINVVVAHLGGGISVGAHLKGKVVDVNNALDGEGPFSPERCGTLPVGALAKHCFSSGDDLQAIKKMIVGKGGVVAYLGTNDMRQVTEMVDEKNPEATLVYNAMAYQIAKAIGAYATVLEGKVDGILLTGGIARDKDFVNMIKNRVSFISDVYTYPGEEEMSALAQGGLRVMTAQEAPCTYE